MIYLSGTYSQIFPQYRGEFGYMLNVNRAMGGELEAVQYRWMLDNGAFNAKWNEQRWLRRIEQLAPHNATCIAAVVPDVVGDHAATLERWHTHAQIVKGFGYKAAFATQAGATPDNLPWPDMDVVFIGDSEERRRRYCGPIIAEARRRGLWIHVGRVNSAKGIMRYCAADSVDGTNFRFPDHQNQRSQEQILWTVKQCNAQRCLQGQLFMLDS